MQLTLFSGCSDILWTTLAVAFSAERWLQISAESFEFVTYNFTYCQTGRANFVFDRACQVLGSHRFVKCHWPVLTMQGATGAGRGKAGIVLHTSARVCVKLKKGVCIGSVWTCTNPQFVVTPDTALWHMCGTHPPIRLQKVLSTECLLRSIWEYDPALRRRPAYQRCVQLAG